MYRSRECWRRATTGWTSWLPNWSRHTAGEWLSTSIPDAGSCDPRATHMQCMPAPQGVASKSASPPWHTTSPPPAQPHLSSRSFSRFRAARELYLRQGKCRCWLVGVPVSHSFIFYYMWVKPCKWWAAGAAAGGGHVYACECVHAKWEGGRGGGRCLRDRLHLHAPHQRKAARLQEGHAACSRQACAQRRQSACPAAACATGTSQDRASRYFSTFPFSPSLTLPFPPHNPHKILSTHMYGGSISRTVECPAELQTVSSSPGAGPCCACPLGPPDASSRIWRGVRDCEGGSGQVRVCFGWVGCVSRSMGRCAESG